MQFGIEDINVNNLEKVMDEVYRFGSKSPMCYELSLFSVAAITELQKLADNIKKRNKLKIED